MNIDVFVKSCMKDDQWLEYLFNSIDKYLTGFRRVIIVTDYDHNIRYKLKHDHEIHYVRQPQQTKKYPHGIGYQYQMYVKLNWFKYTDADAILVADSDYVFTEPLNIRDLYHENKLIWFKRSWDRAETAIKWKKCIIDLFGEPGSSEYMCCPGFVMEKKSSQEFCKYIEEASGLNVQDYVLENTVFSEFNCYASYLERTNDPNYIFLDVFENQDKKLKIRQFWSWGGVTTDIEKEIKKILI